MPETDIVDVLSQKPHTNTEPMSSIVPDDIEEAEVLDSETNEDPGSKVPEEGYSNWDENERYSGEVEEDEEESAEISPEFSADVVISSINGIQQMALGKLAKKKFQRNLSTDQKLSLAQATKSVEEGEDPLSLPKEQKGLLNRYNELMETIDSLPFEEDEMERLKKPLAIYFAKKGIALPPEMALIMTSLEVIGSRVISVL